MIFLNLYCNEDRGIFILCETGVNPIPELGLYADVFSVYKIEVSLPEEQLTFILSEKKVRLILFVSTLPGIVSYVKNKFPEIKCLAVEFSDLLIPPGRREVLDFLTEQGENSHILSEKTLIKTVPDKMLYRGECADYVVLGKIGTDPSSLHITLKMTLKCGKLKISPLNLYSPADREELIKFAIVGGYHAGLFESDLMTFLDLVEKERESAAFPETQINKYCRKVHSHEKEKELVEFLASENLIQKIASTLTNMGLQGEEHTKMVCFLTLVSARQQNPLHVILCGSTGSGKSHLMHTLAACLSDDDVFRVTRLSPKSFYYMKETELHKKMVFIEDMDGLSADSLFAFRELQSSKSISLFRPYADSEKGVVKTRMHRVNASFASITATTKGKIYPDNLSRSILLAMDESEEQIKKITAYQNRKRAGLISTDNEVDARHFVRDILLMIREFEVVNPFAQYIDISETESAVPRMNEQFLNIIEQITLLHQYQRETDSEGRLITSVDDVKEAAVLFAGVICSKNDPLNPTLRRFFERLKALVASKGQAKQFMQREIRELLRLSKSQTQELFSDLRELGYIKVAGGTANKGYLYEISVEDKFQERRNNIISRLISQTEKIKSVNNR